MVIEQWHGAGRKFEEALFTSSISSTLINSMLVVLLVQEKGYHAGQMSLVMGVTPLLVACSCIPWGRTLDRTKRLAGFSSMIQFINGILIVLMLAVQDFTLFFILNLIRNILTLPCSGMQEEYLLCLVNTGQVQYGSVRRWGTIGYAITGLVAPILVGITGLQGIMGLGAVLALTAGIIFGRLPELEKEFEAAPKEKSHYLLKELIQLFHNQRFLIIMVLSFTIFGVLNSASNYGIQALLLEMNAPTKVISALPFITVVLEIVFLTITDRINTMGKEYKIFLLAVFLCMVRWGTMAVTNSYWILFWMAGIHGIVCGMTLGIQTTLVGAYVESEVRSTAFLILSVGGTQIVPAVLNLLLSLNGVQTGVVYFLVSIPGTYLIVRQVISEMRIRTIRKVEV